MASGKHSTGCRCPPQCHSTSCYAILLGVAKWQRAWLTGLLVQQMVFIVIIIISLFVSTAEVRFLPLASNCSYPVLSEFCYPISPFSCVSCGPFHLVLSLGNRCVTQRVHLSSLSSTSSVRVCSLIHNTFSYPFSLPLSFFFQRLVELTQVFFRVIQ